MSTIDPREITHFNQFANEWWDDHGAYRILHQINPLRLQFITQEINSYFTLSTSGNHLSGLRILDVGCGGGLITVPLARLGAQICGIDASYENIMTAKKYSANFNIEYIATTAEKYAELCPATFDVIIGFEIIEHVAQPKLFASAITKLLRPNGLLLLSTINRNIKAYLLAILLAERVLKWVPVNTHRYHNLVKPAELYDLFSGAGFKILNLCGLNFDIIRRKWMINQDININYMMSLALGENKAGKEVA